MFRSLTAVAAFGLLAVSAPAFAQSATYDLTVVDAASGLAGGPFGTVTVTQNGNSLNFVQTLAAGFRIHDSNQNHNAIAFSIAGDPSLTITNLTAGFTVVNASSASSVSAPPFGSFFTAISCDSACGPGFGGGYTGTLSFTVSAANPLTLASLGFNQVGNNAIYFASDVVQGNGSTGNAGAVARAVPSVPEPSIWAMMLFGFGAMGVSLRLRRRGQALLQAA